MGIDNAETKRFVSSKERAAEYLQNTSESKLTRTYFKRLRAKTKKIKTSAKKAERKKGIQLAKQFINSKFGASKRWVTL